MFNPNDMNTYLQRLRSGHGLRVLVIGFCVLTAAVLFFGALLAHGEVDLADGPLFTKINPPPTNLMMLLDDSGSMTFEILVRGAYDGEFPNPAYSSTQGFAYVFDNMGDGYNLSGDWRQMNDETRKYWRSQWHEINAVYYNPAVLYEPWPSYAGKTFPPADTKKPLAHPLKSKTLDLTKKAFTVAGLTVPWSHYYVKADNGTVYLVIIDAKGDPTSQYYIFTTDGGTAPNDKIETFTLVTPPDDIVRDPAEDLQNFANWFTYHRRREFVAKAAIARVLKDLDGVRVGLLGINEQVIEPLKPIKAVISGEFKDETDNIIETLYGYKSGGGTPLKHGLEDVGEYYRVNDGDLAGKKGDAPYPTDGGACQQSFTIVVTDGYYSDTAYDSVGNADGDNDNAEWGGNQVPFKDAYGDTLADIAMHYYATDLIPTMDDQVPTNRWDRAPHQHMVTFAVAFGVSGTLEPDDYEDDRNSEDYMKYITKKEEPREYGAYVVWPNIPGDRRAESIDDLWHATVNGRGVFVNAGEPQKLVEGLLGIIKDIKERQPTSTASVTINGDWLFGKIGPDVLIYQGSYSFIDDEWAGQVSAYRLNQTTGEVITSPPEWLASEKLQAKAWDTRNIITFDGDNSGQVFAYSYLTADQKGKLGPDPESVVNFIRGKDPDGSGNRDNMLGDIVHSAVVFIDDVVYVGANDGMLHAFSAKYGTEIFGYVPYLVFDHLEDLVDPNYDHRFYVDLTPTVKKGNKLLGGSVDDTILVGGLGKGGMGYFALDITNPHAMTKDEVLWEFPNKDTAAEHVNDMGYSYSKPVVAQSYGAIPWIVIVGNGYNSLNGNSVLFILNAVDGTVIRKIQAGTGPDNGLSSPIAVDVNHDDVVDFVYAGDLKGNLWKFDLTDDSAINWKVAFEDSSSQAAPLFVARDSAGAPQPITSQPDVMLHPEKHGYIVCFGTGKFLGIGDYSDTQKQTIYGLWDYGDKVFQAPDIWSPDDDNEYLGAFVSRDRSVRQLSNTYLSDHVKLLQQVADDSTVNTGTEEITVRVLSDKKPFWDTMDDPQGNGQLPDPTSSRDNDAGWYLDLDVYAGERVVSDVILRDGILIVIGFIPGQSRCSSGGDSIFMELNAFTGGSIGAIQFDINDDGVVGEDDLVEVEIDGKTVKVPPSGKKLAGQIQPPAIIKLDEKKEKKYLSSSGGGIVEISEKAAKTGVAYWMELRE